jgi:cobalt-zinc-cadmium efflux system outer membrane protein
MPRTRLPLLLSLLLLCGCRGGPVREETDRAVHEMARHVFDPAPEESTTAKPKTEEAAPPPAKAPSPGGKVELPVSATDIQTVAFMQAERPPSSATGGLPKYELKVPPEIPGSEALPIDFGKMTPAQKQQAIRQLYPELPPLPISPTALPGPSGRPYTLADLQQLAVENSPTLRQAVSDVKAAQGALVQAKTYQNPTIAYQASPTNNNSNAGAQGGYIDQPIRTFGKMKLQIAAAQKDLDNAELALRRARTDLSTNVRNAYFGLIVAQETVRVNQAMARFTDEIYRLYTGYLAGGFAASYEPAAMRAQVYSARLAYKQAITSYIYAWKQLVASLGLPQLPLTEVSGRVDRLIPYYDYDKVLAHVLAHHTDVLTARNGIQKAQYNLKLAQITPVPDVDFLAAVWKESTIPPYVIFYQAQVVLPVPIWDQNKGNIMSAQAALIRAIEESHRVENYWTNTLAANYTNYQNNLNALEYYRRYILPDQVRYYRGVFDRRQVDITASPSDLVTAQQALAANVQTYLGILGSLWSAVVSVADPLQTDDLFQLAVPRELPELPALDNPPRWLCPHNRLAAPPAGGAGNGCSPKCACPPAAPAGPPAQAPGSGTAPTTLPPGDPVLPAPRQAGTLPTLPPVAVQHPQAKPADLTQQLLEPPPEIPKRPGASGVVGQPPSGGEPSP